MSLSKTVRTYWLDYLHQLDKNPVTTKAVTAAVISVLSDAAAQLIAGNSVSQLNLVSLTNQAIIGLLIRGPVVHYVCCTLLYTIPLHC